MKVKLLLALFTFLTLVVFIAPQKSFADSPSFTASNVTYNTATGELKFDISDYGNIFPDENFDSIVLYDASIVAEMPIGVVDNTSCVQDHCDVFLVTHNPYKDLYGDRGDPFNVIITRNNLRYWSQPMGVGAALTIIEHPEIQGISDQTINVGMPLNVNGSFLDGETNANAWTATVDYGDNSGVQPLSLNGKSFSLDHQYTTAGPFAVTINVTNNVGQTGSSTFTVNINSQVPPQIDTLNVSPNPIQVNSPTTATGNFTDPMGGSSDTASWDWGDGSTSTGTVTENNGSGTVTDSHIYTAAGVYPVTLTVTSNVDSVTQTFQYVSVYNPTSQGLFSAGQKYTSPAGAYKADTSLTGSVKFGLSYKYQGGVPSGNKEFSMNFKDANFAFDATSVTSLVTSGNIGTLRGTGTINGSGTYNFLVVGDASANTIRIQIKDQSGNTIYDTQSGRGTSDTAEPNTPVTAGNIIVH